MSRIERNGAPALALVRTAPQPAAAQTRPPRRPPAARPRRAAGMRARATSRPRTRAVCWSRSTACTPRASRRCGCRRRRWPTWRGARARRLRTRPCWVKCEMFAQSHCLPCLASCCATAACGDAPSRLRAPAAHVSGGCGSLFAHAADRYCFTAEHAEALAAIPLAAADSHPEAQARALLNIMSNTKGWLAHGGRRHAMGESHPASIALLLPEYACRKRPCISIATAA